MKKYTVFLLFFCLNASLIIASAESNQQEVPKRDKELTIVEALRAGIGAELPVVIVSIWDLLGDCLRPKDNGNRRRDASLFAADVDVPEMGDGLQQRASHDTDADGWGKQQKSDSGALTGGHEKKD